MESVAFFCLQGKSQFDQNYVNNGAINPAIRNIGTGMNIRNVIDRCCPLFALVAMVGFLTPDIAAAVNLGGLVAHRAVYDVDLLESSDRSGIRAMNGRIVYEIDGSPCDGFAVKFRFVTRIDTSRKSFVTDQRTTTFEDGKGENLRFLTRSYVNDKFEREVSGSAARTSKGTDVVIKKPKKQKLHLGKAIFMTEHLARVIEKAKQGETFYATEVFDGSDNGNELLATTTIIGKKAKPETDTSELATNIKALREMPNWPVSISYFSLLKEQRGENMPIYQVSFDLYENGISSDLKMRYKEYTLKGKLTALEFLPVTPCK